MVAAVVAFGASSLPAPDNPASAAPKLKVFFAPSVAFAAGAGAGAEALGARAVGVAAVVLLAVERVDEGLGAGAGAVLGAAAAALAPKPKKAPPVPIWNCCVKNAISSRPWGASSDDEAESEEEGT